MIEPARASRSARLNLKVSAEAEVIAANAARMRSSFFIGKSIVGFDVRHPRPQRLDLGHQNRHEGLVAALPLFRYGIGIVVTHRHRTDAGEYGIGGVLFLGDEADGVFLAGFPVEEAWA